MRSAPVRTLPQHEEGQADDGGGAGLGVGEGRAGEGWDDKRTRQHRLVRFHRAIGFRFGRCFGISSVFRGGKSVAAFR